MSDALTDWVSQALARSDAATRGPWEVRRPPGQNDMVAAHPWPRIAVVVAQECPATDAAFIAAARTDLPKALAALQAVLDLHQPTSSVGVPCDEYSCSGTEDEACSEADLYGDHELPSCGACSAITDHGNPGEFVYPCPTVRRITAALHL